MILDIASECTKIDSELARFVHNIIILIKIAVPLALIIFGMLDFGKGVIAGKEDEIKKGQNNFIKRLIAGAAVFLMISFTQLIMNIIDKESSGEITSCANLIINGKTGKDLESEEANLKIIEQCCVESGGQYDKDNKESLCTGWDKDKYSTCVNKKYETIRGGN